MPFLHASKKFPFPCQTLQIFQNLLLGRQRKKLFESRTETSSVKKLNKLLTNTKTTVNIYVIAKLRNLGAILQGVQIKSHPMQDNLLNFRPFYTLQRCV